MYRFAILALATAMWTTALQGQPARFIIDDDAFADRVSAAAQVLLREHKLLSLDALRGEVRTKSFPLKPLPLAREKLDPPELCDRLRESTLAVGTLYKCPDCGGWHFSSSTGFVVSESGIVCTCCHVLMEEDEEIKEGYLVAADAAGHVFPVQTVLAADPEADTCLIRIRATGLKPLPLRAGVRVGESVYCLSNPGGYFFMFTQGLVARLNRRTNADTDDQGRSKPSSSRPILLLNVTAEFAPGSSGAPMVDSCGNVVGQVASIADAGENSAAEDHKPASPSVAIRFCTATEEILRLSTPDLARDSSSPRLKPTKKPRQKVQPLRTTNRCPLSRSEPKNAASCSPALLESDAARHIPVRVPSRRE
jgi:serine protease Do